MPSPVNRIDAATAHHRVESGEALLVCAYDSDEKFRTHHLDGAISLSDFRSRADSVPRDREIIFYCA